MNRQALDRVWKEIGENIAKLQKGQRCGVGGPSDFRLDLRNNFRNSPIVTLWAWNTGHFESQAPTVEEGVRDILTQIHEKLGHHPRHRCPVCHEMHDGYDLSLPFEAFDELMREVAEIGTEMSKCKNAGVGSHTGPRFSIELSTMSRPRAKLHFSNLEERYGSPYVKSIKATFVIFRSEGRTVWDAVEKVIAQARDHLAKKRCHPCPICGLYHCP